MAQYDVYASPSGVGFLLDCQSDLLGGLSHRLMVPLLPEGHAPVAAGKLNPIFMVEGRRMAMMTQYAAATPRSELGSPIASLDHHHFAITAAMDMLLHGI